MYTALFGKVTTAKKSAGGMHQAAKTTTTSRPSASLFVITPQLQPALLGLSANRFPIVWAAESAEMMRRKLTFDANCHRNQASSDSSALSANLFELPVNRFIRTLRGWYLRKRGFERRG